MGSKQLSLAIPQALHQLLRFVMQQSISHMACVLLKISGRHDNHVSSGATCVITSSVFYHSKLSDILHPASPLLLNSQARLGLLHDLLPNRLTFWSAVTVAAPSASQSSFEPLHVKKHSYNKSTVF